MSRNQRIKDALKGSGKTQTQLAEKLGVTHATINQRLNSDVDIDSWDLMSAVSDLTGKSIYWLSTGDEYPAHPDYTKEETDVRHQIRREEVYKRYGDLLPTLDDTQNDYLTGSKLRVVTATVDKSGKELISYVPVRAQAGYRKGFADPHYIEQLPAFALPILKTGSYRMFEVDGDSMLQMGGGGLHDGDIVIAQYVEDITSMRDNRVYVVVSHDGVIVKRCLNRLKEKDNAILVCKSDNKNGQYPDIIMRPHEIIEVWELKAFISKQLSFATDIWQTLNDVQVQMALMDEKIKRIEQERLTQ